LLIALSPEKRAPGGDERRMAHGADRHIVHRKRVAH